MTLALIWAADRNGGIGRDNDIPWHISADQRRFRELTSGHPVIMGRRTWESLPERFRPLPNRHNIVVSSTLAELGDNVTCVPIIDEAIAAAGSDLCFVMGGAGMYSAAMQFADELYVTEVDLDIEDADTFAPAIDPQAWVGAPGQWQHTDDGVAFRFVDYTRR